MRCLLEGRRLFQYGSSKVRCLLEEIRYIFIYIFINIHIYSTFLWFTPQMFSSADESLNNEACLLALQTFVFIRRTCIFWLYSKYILGFHHMELKYVKVLLAIWEIFLRENNRNYNSYRFSHKFAFIPLLFFLRK